MNYFINIVLDCSFNHSFYRKRYSVLQQVLITIRSIQQRWNFPYCLNLIHTSELDNESKKLLTDLNVQLYYVKPEINTPQYSLSRHSSYSLELNQKGTHRLIIDCDMIATHNIETEIEKLLKYDIACMYEWSTNIVKSQEGYDNLINYLCKEFNLKKPFHEFIYTDNCWASDYHLTEKKLEAPYYNPGAVFMKEELTKEFAVMYKELWKLLPHTHAIQVGMSLAMQNLTQNIGVLKSGINMLPNLMLLSDKFKNFNKTYLLHCCSLGYEVVSELGDFYLSDAFREKLDYKYYFDKAVEKSLIAQQDINNINDYYKNIDIWENFK